jgi:hypothetical protein
VVAQLVEALRGSIPDDVTEISGSLSLPEPSGPVQACNGIALLFLLPSNKQANSHSLVHNHTPIRKYINNQFIQLHLIF